MKRNGLSPSRCQFAIQGLLWSFLLLAGYSGNAQNLVRNPDFEQPLGPDNWTIVYVLGGPDDFFIKGRTRLAHRDIVPETWDGNPYYWNKFGLHFKAGNDGTMHAYASQVISNLTAGATYTASAYMTVYEEVNKVPKVYMEAIGATAVRTPDVVTYLLPNPPYSRANYLKYSTNVTANASGMIEIRLHFNRDLGTTDGKWRNTDGLFDRVGLVLTSQPPPYLPPYKILSLALSNQNASLQWETVMNNLYRIEVSSNISDPLSWSNLVHNPYVDPNFQATGTNMTFTTNLFANDPAYNPAVPLFFRIYSQPTVP